MKQKSVHRLVYKIESKTLKQNKWSLFLPVSKAMKECPDNIISLNDSQCLRFIDEINGSDDITEKVRNIQRKIWGIKKLPSTRENLKLIPPNGDPKLHPLMPQHREALLDGLSEVLDPLWLDRIWEMIWRRWLAYENLHHSR